ncbi:hypothetical protein QFC19_008655 [Naganishia cerealis]|uniref:Uncharacterized protein n=1 Tax=Naganishia cerealis TaxID=610337 RepID=A0ACC2V052_9TREE|nr:hypothetical protein QFC19_008655 [Naganishia cerealis]
MSLQQSSFMAVSQPAPSDVINNEAIQIEIDAHPQSPPESVDNNSDLVGNVKAPRRETFVLTGSAQKSFNPQIEVEVMQRTQAPTPCEKENQPCGSVPLAAEVVEAKTEGEGVTEKGDVELSAWRRFVDGLAYDPLNEPEFIDAYRKWQVENRKERWDRRRAWIVAHGCKVGRVLSLVKKDKKEKAWAAYREKLAYMED